MKNKIWLGILVGLMCFLFWGIRFSKLTDSETKQNFDWYEVTKVVDGDTIQIRIKDEIESVRLIGIDSAEIEGKTKDEGIKAKNFLVEMVGNQKVRLEKDKSQDDRDIYDRLLRYVFLEDGKMINKEMIRSGMAKEYIFKIPYKYQKEFKELEKN